VGGTVDSPDIIIRALAMVSEVGVVTAAALANSLVLKNLAMHWRNM